MVLPVANMTTTPLRVWEDSTTPNFGLPVSVSDAHSGIKSWTIQRRAVDAPTWAKVISGSTGGSKEPPILGGKGTRFDYRVVAKDRQGNQKISLTRRVYIPRDDDSLGPEGVFSVAPTIVDDGTAFGGKISQMAMTDTLTYTWVPGTDCLFELIGPSSSTWQVTVTADGSPTIITNAVAGSPRQTLYSDDSCASVYVVTVDSGTFGLDAVLG